MQQSIITFHDPKAERTAKRISERAVSLAMKLRARCEQSRRKNGAMSARRSRADLSKRDKREKSKGEQKEENKKKG